MDNWVCYLIRSLDSNCTYIGATNNFKKRITTHNKGKGAKYTKGQLWVPILIVSNFETKNACLSFESGWKRLSRTRKNSKLEKFNLKYDKDTKWNRIMDLLYFVHNFAYVNGKFSMTKEGIESPELHIDVKLDTWINQFIFPDFIKKLIF
jgi:predicted GIY-YIG superfamily endonuclease